MLTITYRTSRLGISTWRGGQAPVTDGLSRRGVTRNCAHCRFPLTGNWPPVDRPYRCIASAQISAITSPHRTGVDPTQIIGDCFRKFWQQILTKSDNRERDRRRRVPKSRDSQSLSLWLENTLSIINVSISC